MMNSHFNKLTLVTLLLVLTGIVSFGRNAVPSPSDAEATNTVTVRISDKLGAIAGASAFVKDTKIGNVSNSEGVVTIKGVPDNATLVISFVGYTTQEITLAKGQTYLEVELVEDTITLDNSVVIGYGSLDKKMVTSSVSSVRGDDMLIGVSGADITTAMQGKIPGLVMYNVGSTNSSTTIQLRGLTSINAGTSPLIVIDGFAGGDIRSLNQEDIKSIDVLKDASAGAIYGTRAASGVIMITTKSGTDTEGKLKLTYSNEFSHKDDYGRLEMLTGREYAQYGIGPDYGNDTDWWDEMINHANFSHKHNLSVNFGTQKASVYMSFFYQKNDGIAIKDSRIDYGGKVNAQFTFFDGWLEVRPAVDYRQARRNNHYPNFRQALRNNPTRSPYDSESETGYNIWTDETLDYNTVADAYLQQYNGLDKWFKPQVNIKLNIKPVKGLSYQQVVGYENRQWELQQYYPSTYRTEVENSRAGQAYIYFSKTENITSEGYFSYDNEWNGHKLDATLGYSYWEQNGENYSMTNYNFTSDATTVWNIGEGTYLTDGKASMSSSKNITVRLMSYFARANYSYKDKYMASASARYEGSSKFAAANRWALFWAFSAGWRISAENWMKGASSWLEDLKIRVGYGVTGNNDFSSSYEANLLGADTRWILPDGSWAYSYGKSQNVNPYLGWEKKYEIDVGLDFSFFKGRLYGKVDWYRRTIDDMIFSVSVPQPPYTQASQYQNIGKMMSTGIEIEVGGDIMRTKSGFTWSSDLNLNHYVGKIITLYGDNTYITGNDFPSPGSPGTEAQIEAGARIGAFHIWKFAGFSDDGKFLLYNKDGDIVDGTEKTIDDKMYIGSYIPKLIVGWNHTLSYKNFDLGINLRSWIKFDVYNTFAMYNGLQDAGNLNLLKSAYGKYAFIHDEKQLCSYYLEDGTFLKIDAITLGYTLPMAKYTRNLIERIRFYFTVGNLCTITGYTGYNPEVDISSWTGGLDAFWQNFFPKVRTWTLGMRFNF